MRKTKQIRRKSLTPQKIYDSPNLSYLILKVTLFFSLSLSLSFTILETPTLHTQHKYAQTRFHPNAHLVLAKPNRLWSEKLPVLHSKEKAFIDYPSDGYHRKRDREKARIFLKLSRNEQKKSLAKIIKNNQPVFTKASTSPLIAEYARKGQLDGFGERERLVLVEEINRLRKDKNVRDDFRYGKTLGRGSGKIHDLVDPCKNLGENWDLNVMNWLPSLFFVEF